MEGQYLSLPGSPQPHTSSILHSDASDRPLLAQDTTLRNENTPTTQHDDIQTLPDIEEKRHIVQGTKSANRLTLGVIVAGWVLAAALAGAHHIFLHQIDNQVVVGEGIMDVGSQFWIKSASGAFVRGVVLALTVSAAATLTQMEWRSSLKNTMRIGDLDNVFKLPSFTSFLSLLFSSLAPFLMLVLALVAALQGLEVVTILAPNALRVQPSASRLQNLRVPTLDLATGNMTSFDSFDTLYYRPSAYWNRQIQRVVMFPESVSLSPPHGCEVGCNYTFTYYAPAINCRDLAQNELVLKNRSGITLYNGTTSLNYTQLLNDEFTQGFNIPYNLKIEWQSLQTEPYKPVVSGRSSGGVYCQFHNATYTASITFSGTSQSITSSVTELGNVLIGNVGGVNGSCVHPYLPKPQYDSGACFRMGMNFRATCDAFARALTSVITYDPDGLGGFSDGGVVQSISGPGSPQLTPLLNINQTYLGEITTWQFGLAVPNLGDTLSSIFTNVTLGLINTRNDFVEVQAMVSNGQTEWSYNAPILWAIYGPTLFIFFLFTCYGVYCVFDGGAVDTSFSAFVVATRNEDLDRACRELPDLDALKKVKLRYEREGGFNMGS